MVLCWSIANHTANHNDLQAMCLACNGHGRCALVSRRCISIFKTNNLAQIDSSIAREVKWDTTYAEFSAADPKRMALINAQTINIYNIDDNSNWFMHTLSGHTRTITDLNWSHKESNLLASASYDNYIYIWDLRETRKPVYLMHSISGANQIKWSKINQNLLATSHEGDVRIWDKRKNNTPICYVSTHLAKINGIDWSPFNEAKFLTYSQDGNIKLWDLTNCAKGKCEYHMNTSLPIWKARYTPFGNGLLTALVPQTRTGRAGENNSVWMWKIDSLDQPVHSFAGHLDVVLDFGWNIPEDSDDFELITWARDNTFRMWKVNAEDIIKNVLDSNHDDQQARDYNEELSSDFDSHSARFSNLDLSKSSNLSSPISERFGSNKSEFDSNFDDNKSSDLASFSDKIVFSLKQEFSLFNANIPNICIEELNIAKRTCIASIKSSIFCRLKIFFPSNYPNTIPQFSFMNDSSGGGGGGSGTTNSPSANSNSTTTTTSSKHLNDSMKKEILKVLQATATLQVQRNRNCLEKCLRQFVQTIEKLTSLNLNVNISKPQPTVFDLLTSHKYGSYLDASVPFPRTSGARFCSSDLLVCFGRPPHLEQMNVPTEYTPRSLSALSAYLTSHVRAYSSNQKDNIPSISSFYIDQSKKRRTFRQHSKTSLDERTSTLNKPKQPNLCGPVLVFSVQKLLPISRHLAEQYLLPSTDDIINLCEMNAKIASTSGRKDLLQTWNLVRFSIEIYLKNRLHSKLDMNSHWSKHPFGGRMIQSIIEHYVLKCNDIQMAAMIVSVVSACKIYCDETFVRKWMQKNLHPQSYSFLAASAAAATDLLKLEDSNAVETPETDQNHHSNYVSNILNSHTFNNNVKTAKKDKNDDDDDDDDEFQRVESTFDRKIMFEYDYYKKIYADILYRWKLIKKRAQLLKTIETKMLYDMDQSTVSFVNECSTPQCKEMLKLCSNHICSNCNRHSLMCSICRLPVKGATNHCLKCGHGGHTSHMAEWFQNQTQCPSGCGCDCYQNGIALYGNLCTT